MKELHHPMKQTRLHVSKYNTIFGKEARVGPLLDQGPLLGLTLSLIKFQICKVSGLINIFILFIHFYLFIYFVFLFFG